MNEGTPRWLPSSSGTFCTSIA